MGPDNESVLRTPKLFFMNGDKAELLCELSSAPQITDLTDYVADKKTVVTSLNGSSFTTRLKPSKRFRCKNRKRFIKLLMSCNVERNDSKVIARSFREQGYSYAFAWFYFRLIGWMNK